MASVEELCDHITLINNSQAIISGPVNDIRQQFKLDIYKVGFEGNPDRLREVLNENYSVISQEKTSSGHSALIKLVSKSQDNELLSLLMPHFHITSFTEEIPGMNDIFIDLVNKHKTAESIISN